MGGLRRETFRGTFEFLLKVICARRAFRVAAPAATLEGMQRLSRIAARLATALALTALVGCAGTSSAARTSSASASAPASASALASASASPIAWQSFDKPAFAQAARENKLVIVDVGIEGCTACRWMYEETYRNPEVVKRMRESFVAVAVDADVEPDLGARFERWGWPATIAMTADGKQVLALRGNRSPEKLIAILDGLLERQKKGTLLDADDDGPPGGAESNAAPASASPLHDSCVRITNALERDIDKKHGGWTDEGPQLIQGAAIEEAFLRASVERRPELRAHALLTLDGYAKMLDPVWGGVYVAAHGIDFSEPIVEKRLVQEAEAMRSFATAYAATRDEKWRRRASEIDRYLESFLLAPDGTFYSTQQDEAPGLPATMSSSEYFALPDAERRKYGVPPVDHAVYTDQNGQAIEAYAMLYEATGDEKMLARAMKAASAILATRLQPSGFVTQAPPSAEAVPDPRKRALRPRVVPFLTAQAHFVTGLVALHRVTGDARWLDAARTITAAMRATLEDRAGGGFFASPAVDGATHGSADVRAPQKPIYENIVAARAFHLVSVYTHDAASDAVAERTLRSVGASGGGAVLALATQDLSLGPVEISIVAADVRDPRAVALRSAALRTYEPRKAVHFEAPGRYPARAKAAAYVCTHTSCSSPIEDEATLAAAVARASADAGSKSCP